MKKCIYSPSQLYSHTPSALNAGAKRRNVLYYHASMLLLGEGSEATEPYNKYAKYFFALVQPKFVFGFVNSRQHTRLLLLLAPFVAAAAAEWTSLCVL